MNWLFPLAKRFRPVRADRFFDHLDLALETGVPLPPHPNAFGVRRRHHTHEGVDLLCQEGDTVYACERGTVVAIEDFTGPRAGYPWWLDTQAVLVEGPSGVIVYGELIPGPWLVGQSVRRGDAIGHVVRVLAKDKGRPRDMLHLELHTPGTRSSSEWIGERPASLLDPTPHLVAAESASGPPNPIANLAWQDRWDHQLAVRLYLALKSRSERQAIHLGPPVLIQTDSPFHQIEIDPNSITIRHNERTRDARALSWADALHWVLTADD